MLIEAPAKINIALNVVGRRRDGYHLVESVLQAISLYDRLEVETGEGEPELRCELPELEGADNLVLRAARLLRQEYGVAQGCRIELVKSIPIAAGLGGGSSDAAATLIALNELWQLGLERDTLLSLGARLGSDVPFFIAGGTAFVEGRGEIINPLPDLPRVNIVLVKPDFALLAGEVYAAGGFALTGNRGSARLLARELAGLPKTLVASKSETVGSEGNLARNLNIEEFLVNDLESGAFALRPELKDLKEELTAVCGDGVLMSGSGPTFFIVCRDQAEAQERAELLEKAGHKVFVAHTL